MEILKFGNKSKKKTNQREVKLFFSSFRAHFLLCSVLASSKQIDKQAYTVSKDTDLNPRLLILRTQRYVKKPRSHENFSDSTQMTNGNDFSFISIFPDAFSQNIAGRNFKKQTGKTRKYS